MLSTEECAPASSRAAIHICAALPNPWLDADLHSAKIWAVLHELRHPRTN